MVCVYAVAVMRRGLDLKASAVRANAARAGQPLILALFDLDELKHLNDTEWHEVADATIRDVATHWRDDLREGDVLARVGGDEFVIVLPNADESAARALLTRLRDDAPYPCSQGWTRWRDDEAIERADADRHARRARDACEVAEAGDGAPAKLGKVAREDSGCVPYGTCSIIVWAEPMRG